MIGHPPHAAVVASRGLRRVATRYIFYAIQCRVYCGINLAARGTLWLAPEAVR